MADRLISVLVESLSWLCSLIYSFRLPIVIVCFVLLIVMRVAMANALRVRRNVKADWGIWGALVFFEILAAFVVHLPVAWVSIQAIVIAAGFITMSLLDKPAPLYTVINGSNLIYEDNSKKYSNSGGDAEKIRRAKDARIKRKFSRKGMKLEAKIPVFSQRFIFKIGPTVQEQQIAKAVSYLNTYYDAYNWRYLKQSNGIKYEIYCELRTNEKFVLKFPKEISDELDWFMVPLGAIDISSKASAQKTPYIWRMQDPDRQYPCLSETKIYTRCPQGFVVGATGGGKSVLLNTIIAHFVNKAKQSDQTKLYLVDAKQVEFAPFQCLEEVAGVALSLEEAANLTTEFVKEMHRRETILKTEGARDLPPDGVVTLKKNICINGQVIPNETVLEYKDKNGNIHKDYAYNFRTKSPEEVSEVCLPDVEEEEKEEEKPERRYW